MKQLNCVEQLGWQSNAQIKTTIIACRRFGCAVLVTRLTQQQQHKCMLIIRFSYDDDAPYTPKSL